MRHFVKHNWVANFVNFICFDPLTFPLVTLVLHYQLEQSSRLSSCISSCILNLFFFIFLDFFVGSKVSNNIKLEIGFTMLTKQILIKVLHNELVKKKVFVGLAGWSTHLGIPKTFFFIKKMISLSWVICPF